MSYITKMRQEINKDIDYCNSLLEKDYIEGKDFSNIIGKYKTIYPNFSDGLKNFASSVGGKGPNQVENVRILKSKLELLVIEIENPTNYQTNSKKSEIVFNNNTSNTNNNNNSSNNTININVNVDDIKKKIEDNTYLGNKDKEELVKKLDELVEIQNSSDSKVHKWEKTKKILSFIVDKGADVAIMFLPQILNAINK